MIIKPFCASRDTDPSQYRSENKRIKRKKKNWFLSENKKLQSYQIYVLYEKKKRFARYSIIIAILLQPYRKPVYFYTIIKRKKEKKEEEVGKHCGTQLLFRYPNADPTPIDHYYVPHGCGVTSSIQYCITLFTPFFCTRQHELFHPVTVHQAWGHQPRPYPR